MRHSQLIGNSLRKYIDYSEPKDGLFSCARICMEVDLEKCLSRAVNFHMDSWSHVQEVDYDQLPFKCKLYHEYEHFSKGFPKGGDSMEKPSGGSIEQWNQVKHCKSSKCPPHDSSPSLGTTSAPLSCPPSGDGPGLENANRFEVLRSKVGTVGLETTLPPPLVTGVSTPRFVPLVLPSSGHMESSSSLEINISLKDSSEEDEELEGLVTSPKGKGSIGYLILVEGRSVRTRKKHPV